jgi:hypothetical protein
LGECGSSERYRQRGGDNQSCYTVHFSPLEGIPKLTNQSS